MKKLIKFLSCVLLCIFVMSSNTFVSYAAKAGGGSSVFGEENGTDFQITKQANIEATKQAVEVVAKTEETER